MSILTDQPTRVITYFAADFTPQVAFTQRLPVVGELIAKKLNETVWSVVANQYTFRSKNDPVLLIVDHRRLAMQTLGFTAWRGKLSEHGDLVKSALSAYGIQKTVRLGFKVTAFLDLKMSHAELRELFFGSFLATRDSLTRVVGDLDDLILHLEGKRGGQHVVLVATPYNAEQFFVSYSALPNLPAFKKDTPFDTTIADFGKPMNGEGLLIDIDISRNDIDSAAIAQFLRDSLAATEAVADSTVQHLKALPQKG